MSIRIKLMITYAALVIISALVIIFSGINLFTSFITEASTVILEDTDLKTVTSGIVDLLADLRYVEKYESNKLKDELFLNELVDKTDFYQGGMVIRYDDKMIASDSIQMSESFYDQLVPGKNNSHENYITESGREYIYIDYLSEVNGGHIEYYFIVDVSGLKTVRRDLGQQSFRAFISLLLIVMLPVLWIISKDIIQPLKELSGGVDHIKEGDLNFSLKSKKNNEIGSVINSFETMRSKLKDSLDSQLKFENNRKELISSISHDLKTPITSIKGHVEGIKDGVANTPEKLEKYLDVIYQKSVDMDQLIDDLFLFSKLDLKKLPFDTKSIEVADFIKEIIQEMTFDFNQEKTNINFQSNIDESVKILIDPLQMKRVIVNIIQNSMKYMDKEERRIEVILNDAQEHIQIVIKDNGIGIKEEHLKSVFERFYRVDESRNPESGGTGLGLAIAKQIVNQHQGSLRAYSQFGHGTKMVIELSKEG